MESYKHSGAIPLSAVLLILGAGLPAVLIGGPIYTFAVVYIPFIYVSALLAFGYGALIGGVVGWSAFKGKLRNNTVLTGVAFLFALLGLYVAWGVDPMARIGTGVRLRGFDPLFLWNYVAFLYDEGSWGLSEGVPIRGPLLAAVWLAEAAIVTGTSVVVARARAANAPFCERCDRWTQREQGLVYLAADGQEPAWQQLQLGDIRALDRFAFGSTDDGRTVRLDLSVCPQCMEGGFLSAEAVTYAVDKKGNVSEKTTPVFSNLTIDRPAVEAVLAKATLAAQQAEQEQQAAVEAVHETSARETSEQHAAEGQEPRPAD